MLLILVAAFCVVASASQDCFKYGETHGKHQKSLGKTANECRGIHGVNQPFEAHCVVKAYGAVDEDWGVRCNELEMLVDDYIVDKSRAKKMKNDAIKGCGCQENIADENERKEFGQKFMKCYKQKVDENCPEDTQLVSGLISTK